MHFLSLRFSTNNEFNDLQFSCRMRGMTLSLVPDQIPDRMAGSLLTSHRRTVYAWQIDTPLSESNDPHQQQLPNAITKLTAHDNRVGIVLRNWEIYIWDIGRPKNPLSAVPLPIKPNLDKGSSREVVLFHPYKRGKLVCSETMTSSDSTYSTKTYNMLADGTDTFFFSKTF